MSAALPLGLRNRLAELILDAFDLPEARRTLDAVAEFCAGAEGRLDDDAVKRLVALGWFEAAGPGRLRVRGAHRAHAQALCARARAASVVLGGRAAPSGGDLAGLLTRAAWLARAGLYFEVHELLEPTWMRADGGARVGLQGLIQVAVALQHEANGNRAGACSLLGEGLAKLAGAEAALPVETARWRGALAGVLDAWRKGATPPPVPPWPAPGEAAGARTPGQELFF